QPCALGPYRLLKPAAVGLDARLPPPRPGRAGTASPQSRSGQVAFRTKARHERARERLRMAASHLTVSVDERTRLAQKRLGELVLDKWRLDRLIGIGGMAAVFEATHRNGNRVAIKMLHPDLAGFDEI